MLEVAIAFYRASFLDPGPHMTHAAIPSFRTWGAQIASTADAFDGSISLDNVKYKIKVNRLKTFCKERALCLFLLEYLIWSKMKGSAEYFYSAQGKMQIDYY